ncbi:MAG: iron ABC transporter permease [Planctomycetes bacterium]|nr:iron ABC transporter permease [Planctomycetota bacterium]NUQ03390.1 iron ABC transporter permease [Anaerolineae bacterium]
MRPRVIFQYALLAALLGLFAVFLIYPIWLTVRGGFASDIERGTGFTFSHIAAVFEDPVLRDSIVNSLCVAATTTTIATIIALPLAVLAASYRYPLKGLWNALVLVPMILPPFVGAIGLRAILGREGSLNALLGTHWDILGEGRFWGVCAAQALSLYPIIYLNATAALANLDPALDEAAQSVGTPWRTRFFKITLPLIRPGLFAGATIVFIWSFTELGAPLMFDYYTVAPVQIFNGIKEVGTSPTPYALTVVMLAIALGLYASGRLLFGGKGHAMYAKASRAGGEVPLTGWRGALACGLFTLVTLAAITPHLGVVFNSLAVQGRWYDSVLPSAFTLDHYGQALGHPLAFGAIVNSLKLAAAAVAIDLVLGILIGYVIVRTNIRGRAVLDACAMLPLAVPGLVMAFGYVAMSLSWPLGPGQPLAGFADVVGSMPNPVPLLIIAYAVRRLPYIVRSTVAGLQQTSGEMEEAAVNLGASTFTAVRTVIVPLIMANLIAGGLLAFSFAMLEVSDSLILAQQEQHFPITKAIYGFADRLGDGPHIASAMGVWGMALLGVTLVGASVVMGKKLGAIFRV